jgi:hypothetical protein
MKSRLAAFVFALLTASSAFAVDMRTVLTTDGTLYAVDGGNPRPYIAVRTVKGNVLRGMVVPASDGEAVESDVRLLWDGVNSTLFVVWHSAAADRDSIMLQALSAEGVWSEPVVLASCSSQRRVGLQTMLTHAPANEENTASATLIHAAWWGVGETYTAEYALAAFEAGELVSTDVARLDELANRAGSADDYEDTGAPLHPPLAMTRDGRSVDVVFGSVNTTKLTRVKLDPRKVVGHGRFWKPSGRNGGTTGPARLVAADAAPLQAFVSRGRIVLYDPAAKFRYVMLENGEWTPERMIQLDGHVTTQELLAELQRTVDGQSATDAIAAEQ